MDVTVDGAALRGLRERCYCREASAETVVVYLAALERWRLEAASTAAPVPVHRARRRLRAPRPRVGLGVLTGGLTVVVAAALIGVHGALPVPSAPPAHAAPIAAPAAAGAFAPPPAPGNRLATLSSAGAWSTGPLEAGGRIVVLSGLCRGEGTYDVRIGTEPKTTLVCDWGGPSYAMVSSIRPQARFTVTVTRTPGQPSPEWNFSVGTLDAQQG